MQAPCTTGVEDLFSFERARLAESILVTVDAQRDLHRIGDTYTHQALARNVTLDPELARTMARTGEMVVLTTLAVTTPLQELHQELLASFHDAVVASVLRNPRLPVALQHELAETHGASALSANPALVEDLQWQASRTSSMEFLEELCANPALVPALQRELSELDDIMRRKALASNPSLTEDLQEMLALSDSFEVHEELACRGSLTAAAQEELANSPSPSLRMLLARRPDLTEAVAAVMAEDIDMVACMLAANDHISVPTQERLVARAEDMPSLLSSLASNPSLVLHDRLPVSILMLSSRGWDFLSASLEGYDRATSAVLVKTWTGTLRELVNSVRVLGPDVAN